MQQEGWKMQASGEVTSQFDGAATHPIEGSSETGSIGWTAETDVSGGDQSYRLAGWIGAIRGQAQLGVDLLDATGQTLDTAATVAVGPADAADEGANRHYAAVEFDAPAGATLARA